MIIEISVGVIAIAFVILVIFLTMTLRKVMHLSKESQKLIKNTNDLALDLKEKSEALDTFFRSIKKKLHPKNNKVEKIAEVLNFATDGIVLFNRFKKKHR
jgi:uncharacterized protein YoxC